MNTIRAVKSHILTDYYPVKLQFAAQAESVGTLGRVMKAFAVKVSNFKVRPLAVQVYPSIHCSHWSVHFDIWASRYLAVLKLR